MEDEKNKLYTFIFESNELIKKTEDYEILDIVKGSYL